MKPQLCSLVLVAFVMLNWNLIPEVKADVLEGCTISTISNQTGVLKPEECQADSCYVFKLTNITGMVLIDLQRNLPELARSVAVYNIPDKDTTDLIAKNDEGSMLVMAYGRPAKSVKDEVIRVVVNTSSVTSNCSLFGKFLSRSKAGFEFSKVLGNLEGEVSSPLFQSGVGVDFNLTYQYSSTSDSAISFTFTDYNISAPRGLRIQANSSSSPVFNVVSKNNGLPSDVFLPALYATPAVTMKIDPKVDGGFQLSAAEVSQECSGVVKITSPQSVVSPNKAAKVKNYSNNLRCRWLLHTDSNKRLALNVSALSLAKDLDNVMVKDGGASRGAQTLSSLKGQSIPDHMIYSSTNELWLSFETDEAGVSTGFEMTAIPLVDGGRYKSSGNISYSPQEFDVADVTFVLQAESDEALVRLSPAAFGNQLTPPAVVTCYDGENLLAPITALYRSDYLAYPAVSTQPIMTCLAQGLHTKTDVFNASFVSVTQADTQFSSGAQGSYHTDLSTNGSNSNSWVILPWVVNSDDHSCIDLTVTGADLPALADTASGAVSVTVTSLTGSLLYNITRNTTLPISLRAMGKKGIRLEVSSNMTSKGPISYISVDASYSVCSYTNNMTSDGKLSTALYPQGMPADLHQNWLWNLPANKSLQMNFAEQFGLPNGSFVIVYFKGTNGSNNTHVQRISGPLSVAPGSIIVNNTNNVTRLVGLYVLSENYTTQPGFSVDFATIDAGYSASVDPQKNNPSIHVAPTQGSPYSSVWSFNWPKNDSKGNLYNIEVNVSSTGSNSSYEIRDGVSPSAPLIMASNGSKNSFRTTRNQVYIQYSYKPPKNNDGKPVAFSVSFASRTCDNSSQCIPSSNGLEAVCIPQRWKCDGVYQCSNGLDEEGCKAPPKPPAVSKEGAAWWVVGVCTVMAFIVGIVAAALGTMCVLKRRYGYHTLREMMAPVPT